MLVPISVYGTQVAYWGTKLVTEEWPNDSGNLLIYALGCIALLLMMSFCLQNGYIEGKTLVLSIVLPGLITLMTVLIRNYMLWGYLSVFIGFEFILVLTFFPPLVLMLMYAIR